MGALPNFVSAQQAEQTNVRKDSATIEEVIVTAQKRSESIQKVPIAITAISSETLQRQHLFDPSQLPLIAPSLQESSVNNQVGATNFSVRGIGTAVAGPSIESSVATVIDEVAMSRPTMSVVQFFDLDRVEVLRGPQGMLFGKNASAGLINIVTAKPTVGEFGGLAHLSYGNMNVPSSGNEVVAQGALNVPVSNTSALRISGFVTRQDAFEKNVLTSAEDLGLTEGGLRIKYLLRPSDSWEVYLAADYAHEQGITGSLLTRRFDAPGGFIQAQDALVGITASPNNLKIASNAPNYNRFNVGGFQANVTHTLGNGSSITNIAAIRSYEDRSGVDLDQLPISFFDKNDQGRDQLQVSDELRLTSASSDRFQYQVGLYYLHLRSSFFVDQAANVEPIFPPPPAGFSTLAGYKSEISHSNSYAVFGQGRYSVFDQLRLTAGARYTYDFIDENNVFPSTNALIPLYKAGTAYASINKTNFSFRVGAEYDLAPEMMGYVTYARGYKGPAFDENTLRKVDPEIPESIEVGLKSTFFDRKLMFNVALYHTDFHGFQVEAYSQQAVSFITLNAGNLRTQGIEAEFQAIPLEGLTVNGGASFDDAVYQSFPGAPCYFGEQSGISGTNVCLPNGTSDASGNRLAFAPKWTTTLSANYERHISSGLMGFIQGNYYYRSSVNFNPAGDPQTHVGGFSMVGASLGLEPEGSQWRLSVFVRNMFDKRVASFIVGEPLSNVDGDARRGGDYYQQFEANSFRTVGISLDCRF
jgi:iron complex outermembrane receptor protein